MAAGTFTVAGQRVRTSSTRRFVAWVVHSDGRFAPSIMGRSDSVEAIRTKVRRRGYWQGTTVVIIDTATGQEVRSF